MNRKISDFDRFVLVCARESSEAAYKMVYDKFNAIQRMGDDAPHAYVEIVDALPCGGGHEDVLAAFRGFDIQSMEYELTRIQVAPIRHDIGNLRFLDLEIEQRQGKGDTPCWVRAKHKATGISVNAIGYQMESARIRALTMIHSRLEARPIVRTLSENAEPPKPKPVTFHHCPHCGYPEPDKQRPFAPPKPRPNPYMVNSMKTKIETAICLDQLNSTRSNSEWFKMFENLIGWGRQRNATIVGIRTSNPLEWMNDASEKITEENKHGNRAVLEFEVRS